MPYSLKTTATIHKPEGFDEIMPEMHELVGLLENADYTSLDKDEYKKLHDALQIGAEKVNRSCRLFCTSGTDG